VTGEVCYAGDAVEKWRKENPSPEPGTVLHVKREAPMTDAEYVDFKREHFPEEAS